MKNFDYSIGTTVFFGKDQIEKLGAAVKRHASSVLLVSGKTMYKTGIYENIAGQFRELGIRWIEFSDIEPNPRITSVAKGADLCKQNQVESIVAVGGGSVIDCAKAIAAAAKYEGDPWDLVLDPSKISSVLPVFTVSTFAATGSEMDPVAVISNNDTNQKLGLGHPDMRPRYTVLDPTYTFSLPKFQTASGAADIFSHICEVYFSMDEDAYMLDRVSEALLKTCIKYGPVALSEPDNYVARANLLWASEWAINGFISLGKQRAAWSIHSLQHPIGGVYNITHGAGLAVLTPHWMRYVLSDDTVGKLAEYGVNVWDIDKNQEPYKIANEAIDKTEQFFFESLELPRTLRELGVSDKNNFEKMADMAVANGLAHAYVPLTKQDAVKLYEAAF